MARIRMTRKVRVVTVISAVLVLGVGFYWGYHVPSRQSSVYRLALGDASDTLKRHSATLADTASLPVFSDYTEDLKISQDNLVHVSELLRQQDRLLDEYEKLIPDTHPPYLYALNREYTQTKALQLRAQVATKQSRQVVDKYSVLTQFLGTSAVVKSEYTTIVTRFTNMTDLNEYVGRSNELRADAQSIASLARRLESAAVPVELAALRTQVVALYDETAAGYRDLADGIDAAVDDLIYTAARRIEAAIATYDSSIPVEFLRVMESSIVIKQLEELPDKYAITLVVLVV